MISMVMLIVPFIPHHHHSNGIICMNDDTGDTECASDHHRHRNDDPCCTSDCMTRFESPEPASQSDGIQPQYIYSITLFTEPLLRFITQPGERSIHQNHVYRESLYGTFITCAAGLRAPPAFVV